MKSFFTQLIYKMSVFMYGRYGFDKLSKEAVIFSLVLILIANIIRPLRFLFMVGWILILIAWLRAFSKNIPSRQRELSKYIKLTDKLRKRLNLIKRIWKDRKKYKYFKCKNCGAFWRVPRGMGVTEITCRICKEKMTKKS